MIPFTPTMLYRAVGELSSDQAAVWFPHIQEVFEVFEIGNSLKRAADFLAQTAHESGGFRLLREVWGPNQVPEQRTYERDFSQPWGSMLRRGDRNFKAFNMGNAQVGDGYLFRGWGLIQTTGRTASAQARDELRALLGASVVPDFEVDPGAGTQPRWAAMSGGLFWRRNDLNRFADRDDFIGQTQRINGGTNGLSDRQARRAKARLALGLGSV